MKKDRIYKLKLALNSQCDVILADCGCPAGKAPHGSCNHIGTLCYVFAEFRNVGITPQFLHVQIDYSHGISLVHES